MLRTVTFALATSALVAAAAASYGAPSATLVAAAHAATPGRAQYGAFGFDSAGMDRSVLPGDDFYRYANGTWAKNTAIPADKASIGVFEQLQDLSDQRTRDLLEEAKADPSSKIGRAYASFLNTAAMLGVDACPMEGFDPAQFDQILGLDKKGYTAVVIATAGYRAEDDGYAKLAKVRYSSEDVISNVA